MEIYEIKLNRRDLQILAENLADKSLKERFLQMVKTFPQTPQEKVLTFDEKEIDTIIDCLQNLLCAGGLANNDEPNAFGYYIESLIDKFHIE